MSRRAVLAVAGVLVVVVAGLTAWRLVERRTALQQALELAPDGTSRASWTDWAAVRREVGADVGPGSSAEQVDAFLAEAFPRDLSSMSALGTSAGVMQEELGFSPATVSWELLAQSGDGAVEVLGVGEDVDLDDVADRLGSLGWTEPDEDDGVWVGGPDVLSGVGSLTPELQHVALLADEGLVLTSDQAAYLERALDVVRGDRDGASDLADVAGALDDPLAAATYDGAYACEKLAMAQADDDAQAEADQLVEAAGGVHPAHRLRDGAAAGRSRTRGAAGGGRRRRAGRGGGTRAARRRTRAGQGGDFGDRFSVEQAGAQGRDVVLDLRPVAGQYVLSDLTSGPVLFATC